MLLKMTDKDHFFSTKIVEWYRVHARDLPWRSTRDPYRIWICEVMSQQTGVETLLPYYRRFTERFPRLEDLAAASEPEVLKLWEGLGYYSRAKNLRKAACVLKEVHGSKFPRRIETLLKVPGIGPYTAGAILSIAFGQREPAIDGNFLRVYSRYFGWHEAIDRLDTRKKIEDHARKLLPLRDSQRIRDFTEGVMDLGSSLCRPKQPQCSLCPIKSHCVARREGLQAVLPKKEKRFQRQKLKEEVFLYLQANKIALLGKGLDPKYPDFHRLPFRSFERETKRTLSAERLKYSVTVRDFDVRLSRACPPKSILKNCRFVTRKKMDEILLPAVDRKILNRHLMDQLT